jgi:hypothetical protein
MEYLLGYALDATINDGSDYEDADRLNSYLRVQRFTGCTGSVLLEQTTNDRRLGGFLLTQKSWPDITNNEYEQTNVGSYHPLASTVLSIDGLIWADGSTDVPDDLFTNDNDCPFSDDDVKRSNFGVMVGCTVCFGILGVMIGVSWLVWKKFWNCTLMPLNYRAPFSQSDLQHILTMIIEFVQTMAMGPTIRSLNHTIWAIGMMCTVDLSNLIDMK